MRCRFVLAVFAAWLIAACSRDASLLPVVAMQDTGPSGRDIGPKGQDTGPNGQDIGPNGQDTGPNGQDIGPNGEDVMSGRNDAGDDREIGVDGPEDLGPGSGGDSDEGRDKDEGPTEAGGDTGSAPAPQACRGDGLDAGASMNCSGWPCDLSTSTCCIENNFVGGSMCEPGGCRPNMECVPCLGASDCASGESCCDERYESAPTGPTTNCASSCRVTVCRTSADCPASAPQCWYCLDSPWPHCASGPPGDPDGGTCTRS